jgi:hypothetical protein
MEVAQTSMISLEQLPLFSHATVLPQVSPMTQGNTIQPTLTTEMTTDLPSEIWLSILEEIASEASIPPESCIFPHVHRYPNPARAPRALNDLCNLSLVSRKLGGMAQGLLYREISIGYGLRNLPYGCRRGRLASLVTTLTARRDLADMVRRVFIHGDFLWALTGEEIDLMVRQASSVLGFIAPSDFPGCQTYAADRTDEMVDLVPTYFLIFCLMRNLESIIFFPACDPLPDWFPPPAGGCRFPRLKSFELTDWADPPRGSPSMQFWPKNIAQLLGSQCPATTVTLHCSSHLCDILGDFPQLANLRFLSLSMPGTLNHDHWTRLHAPEHFTGLRSFRYFNHFGTVNELFNALEALSISSSTTLCDLAINLDFLHQLPPGVSALPINSFSNLETLVIRDRSWSRRVEGRRILLRPSEAPWIFSAESLPPSTRRVFLIFPEASVAGAVKDDLVQGLLHAAQSGRLPQLRQVHFWMDSKEETPELSDDVTQGLALRGVFGEAPGVRQLFGDVGVDFRVLDGRFTGKGKGYIGSYYFEMPPLVWDEEIAMVF